MGFKSEVFLKLTSFENLNPNLNLFENQAFGF
jgi:hypothetical protein